MRSRNTSAVIFAALTAMAVSAAAQSEESVQKRKSHLGFGLGLSHTASQVSEIFGQGTDASLFANQHIYKGFGARFLIGGIYLGAPEESAKLETYLTGLEFFGSSFSNFSMSFEYISLGPSYFYRFGERHSLSATIALSLCSVKLEVAALSAHRFKISNGQWGYNAGAMYAFWIGDSWGLHTRVEWNQIYTKKEPDDLYYVFVRGDSNPQFISWLVGVQIGYQ